LSDTGQKTRSFVYLQGEVLAWQQKDGSTESVLWEPRDPSNASYRMVGPGGSIDVDREAELDPQGSDAGVISPYNLPHHQWPGQDLTYPGFADMISGNCAIDGIAAPCSMTFQLLRSASAGECPDGNCGPRYDANRDEPGRGGWQLLRFGPNGFYYEAFGPSAEPQRSADADRVTQKRDWARRQAAKNYDACLKELKGTLAPGRNQAADILAVSAIEHVDATLMAVTWGSEAIPPFDSNPRWNNKTHSYDGADVGPMGIANNGVYAKAPFISGLANPMGTFTTEKKRFDGDPFDNLRWAARAYTMDILKRTKDRAQAAGLYRAGTPTGPGYSDRIKQFNGQSRGYDNFFKCLKEGPK
jgi:hypothetical protein